MRPLILFNEHFLGEQEFKFQKICLQNGYIPFFGLESFQRALCK